MEQKFATLEINSNSNSNSNIIKNNQKQFVSKIEEEVHRAKAALLESGMLLLAGTRVC
jgi:hypothetical protein